MTDSSCTNFTPVLVGFLSGLMDGLVLSADENKPAKLIPTAADITVVVSYIVLECRPMQKLTSCS